MSDRIVTRSVSRGIVQEQGFRDALQRMVISEGANSAELSEPAVVRNVLGNRECNTLVVSSLSAMSFWLPYGLDLNDESVVKDYHIARNEGDLSCARLVVQYQDGRNLVIRHDMYDVDHGDDAHCAGETVPEWEHTTEEPPYDGWEEDFCKFVSDEELEIFESQPEPGYSEQVV